MEAEYKTRTRTLIDDVVQGAYLDPQTDEMSLETKDVMDGTRQSGQC